MVTSVQIVPNVLQLRNNPIAIMRMMLRTQKAMNKGAALILGNATPFAFLMEGACTLSSAAMSQNDTNNAKQYPVMAQQPADLYLHMSDKDYLNRFAVPAQTSMNIFLSYDEVIQKAIQVYDASGNSVPGLRKLTIPRFSRIMAVNAAYTMQYPIDIFVTSFSGPDNVSQTSGVRLLYDLSKPSKLYVPTSDQVDWGIGTSNGAKFIRITVPIGQFDISSQTANLNGVTGFAKNYAISDQFFYCRAYTKYNSDTQWTEIKTTHTPEVYDPNVPTLVCQVNGNQLLVSLPQIYFTNQRVKDAVRVDIYTTKGAYTVDFANYNPGFQANWVDYDQVSNSLTQLAPNGTSQVPSPYAYFAPLMSFNQIGVMSEEVVTGGSDGPSFNALKNQVIGNLVQPTIPISPANLESAGANLGYDIVLNKDNVTDRQYTATRALPSPTNGSTTTGAGCSIRTLSSDMQSLVSILGADGIADNGARITLLPSALFRLVSGVVRPVSASDSMTLLNPSVTAPATLAALANSGEYLYTPYYYVWDTTNDQFAVRPYRLDAPTVTSKFFQAINQLMLINASTNLYSVGLTPDKSGYTVAVQLKPDATLNAIVTDGSTVVWNPATMLKSQLSYVPQGGTQRRYFQGVLVSPIDPNTNLPVGGLYIYHFTIPLNWDIDNNHNMILSTYEAMALTTEFDLVYYAATDVAFTYGNPPTPVPSSDIDVIVDPSKDPAYVPADGTVYRGLNWEKMTIQFGTYLADLWARSRTAVSSIVYQKYPADVHDYYSKSVFLMENGVLKLTYWSVMPAHPTLDCLTFIAGQQYSYVIVYDANDPVLTPIGEAAYVAYVQAQLLNRVAGIIGLSQSDQDAIVTLINNYITIAAPNISKGFVEQLRQMFSTDPTYSADLLQILANTITALGVPNANINAVVRGLSIRQWWSTISSNPPAGYQAVKYAKGTSVLDANNNPVPVGGNRGLLRMSDILFVDGIYYFATAESTSQYKVEFGQELFDWITQDIPLLAESLLELTEIFFFPKTSQGTLRVRVSNGVLANIAAAQKLTARYVLSDANYKNKEFIAKLQETTAAVIAVAMQASVISVDSIEEQLRVAFGSDIKSVKVSGFAIDLDSGVSYQLIELLDSSAYPSLAKTLTVLSDQTLAVQDAITFNIVNIGS